MSAHKMHHSPELLQAMKNHGLVIETPSQLSDCFRFGWSAATDLSQASVAAALEAAAAKLQNVADNWDCGHNESRLCDCAPYVEQWGLAADDIRALITPDQHDALAAHVAAEVAKARAEDAAKIEAASRVMGALDKLDAANAFSRPNAVPQALWDNLDAAKYQYRALSQIGAKP